MHHPVVDNTDRCWLADRCADRRPTFTDTGEHDGWVGATIGDDTYGLCRACEQQTRIAIRSLPGDVLDLGLLLTPSTQRRFQDPRLPVRPKPKRYPALPLRIEPLALVELIDHETTVWADSVARAAGLGWSARRAARWRRIDRIDQACTLLFQHMPWLLSLRDEEHPARSLTEHRADGHDPDATVRAPWDYMTVRSGLHGAAVLIELHHAAERMVGRHPANRLPTPCPRCRRRTLVREHSRRRVLCRIAACGWDTTDDVYERIRLGSGDDFVAMADHYHRTGALPPGFWAERNREAVGER